MEILVFSDSHGRSDRIRRVLELNKSADAIIHLGDGYRDLDHVDFPDVPLYIVKGNGEDWLTMRGDGVPRELMICSDGVNILMMHGHTFDVKHGKERAMKYAADNGADILLFGHTHSSFEKTFPAGSDIGFGKLNKDLMVFNPGSLGEPRFEEPSFGVITIRNGKIMLSHGKIDF